MSPHCLATSHQITRHQLGHTSTQPVITEQRTASNVIICNPCNSRDQARAAGALGARILLQVQMWGCVRMCSEYQTRKLKCMNIQYHVLSCWIKHSAIFLHQNREKLSFSFRLDGHKYCVVQDAISIYLFMKPFRNSSNKLKQVVKIVEFLLDFYF